MQNEGDEADYQSTPTFAAGASSVTLRSPDFGKKTQLPNSSLEEFPSSCEALNNLGCSKLLFPTSIATAQINTIPCIQSSNGKPILLLPNSSLLGGSSQFKCANDIKKSCHQTSNGTNIMDGVDNNGEAQTGKNTNIAQHAKLN